MERPQRGEAGQRSEGDRLVGAPQAQFGHVRPEVPEAVQRVGHGEMHRDLPHEGEVTKQLEVGGGQGAGEAEADVGIAPDEIRQPLQLDGRQRIPNGDALGAGRERRQLLLGQRGAEPAEAVIDAEVVWHRESSASGLVGESPGVAVYAPHRPRSAPRTPQRVHSSCLTGIHAKSASAPAVLRERQPGRRWEAAGARAARAGRVRNPASRSPAWERMRAPRRELETRETISG